MFAFLPIIVLTSMVIGGVSLSVSYRHLRSETLNISGQLVYQVLLNVDYRSAEFEKLAYDMVSDYKFQQIARSYQSHRNQIEGYQNASTLGTIISGMTISNPDIVRIYILMADGTAFSWQKGNPKVGIDALGQQEKSKLDRLAEVERSQANVVSWNRANDGSIQLVMQIIDTDNLSLLGSVVYEMKPEHFRISLPSESSLLDPANIVVLNQENDTLVSAEDPLMASLVDHVLQQQELGNDLNSRTFRYEGNSYLMVQANAEYSKWKVLSFVPMDTILRKMNVITYSTMSAGLGSLLLASLLAWILSGLFTRNIRLLQENMKKVEKGDFETRVRPVSYDELGRLGLQFNDMVGKIRNLIREVADERIMRQAKEFEVLQTQVNPHFLYNTLGSIKSLAQLNEQPDIVRMTTCLIEILKAALNKKTELWKFYEELSFVDLYIDLQKIRYQDHFRVEYDIAAETEALYVVGFVLQPLVENALYHAFELERPGGVIRIGSRIDGGQLRIWVRDNGSGMDADTVARIKSRMSKQPKGLNSIGVKNVDERIKYQFGEEYGLTFASAVGQGTTVEIRMPIMQEDTTR
ncbi:sensor histidine kinase [Cohnella fermenti]|nr:histidine kinase [Cohnella fermenti]